jgi:Flp pilus assembly secretin CpaC
LKSKTSVFLSCLALVLFSVSFLIAAENTDYLSIPLGASKILKTSEPLVRMSVGNPLIADYTVLSRQEAIILALKTGHTELYVWTESGKMETYNVSVYDDCSDIKVKLADVLGRKTAQRITVSIAKDQAILTGTVETAYEADEAEKLAKAYYASVVNLLQIKAISDTATVTGTETGDPYAASTSKSSRIFTLNNAKILEDFEVEAA